MYIWFPATVSGYIRLHTFKQLPVPLYYPYHRHVKIIPKRATLHAFEARFGVEFGAEGRMESLNAKENDKIMTLNYEE